MNREKKQGMLRGSGRKKRQKKGAPAGKKDREGGGPVGKKT